MLEVSLEPLDGSAHRTYYHLSLTEDVINKPRNSGKLQSESHMQHIQGNWNTEKIYWLNFHQARNEVVEIAQIRRLIDFLA